MRFLITLFVSGTMLAQNGGTSWNFDRDTVNQIPAAFSNDAGAWKVVADNGAPSKPNVIAQTAKSSGPTFNVTLIENTNYKDVDLSVSMKAVAGATDQGGGLIWRARDARNYYIARFNPLENNYRVYKVQNGIRTQFQNADIRAAAGWHTLRITMTGDHIECYFDGMKYLDVHDSTFKEGGKIGLWTKSDAQSYFDDLKAARF
jgi:3-keto-disaccharide hydrolase